MHVLKSIQHTVLRCSLLILACFGWSQSEVFAQQVLNLDFDKLSIEGMSRPWNWAEETYTGTLSSLDSTEKHHGSYSLRISNDEASDLFVFSHYLEPYELAGRHIRVEGWLRTQDLQGKAMIGLRFDLEQVQLESKFHSEVVFGSQDWTKVMVSSVVPKGVSSISIDIQFEGIGKAWYDDLVLYVDGKPRTSLELNEGFTKDQLQWIEARSEPISTSDPTQIEDGELAGFAATVKDARIIALGESTHGTREFFQLKHRLLKYSVEELGVRIFAIEDHQLVVQRVNDYITGGEGTARSCMYGMLGVWQTEEVCSMIQWMRNFNDSHPDDPVAFVGFDIQNHSLAIDQLYTFLEQRDPDVLSTVRSRLEDLHTNGNLSYLYPDSVKKEWYLNAQTVVGLVDEVAKRQYLQCENREDSLKVAWGMQYARLIKQFTEHTFRGHASLYRDVAMAENVSWILNQYKSGSKMLIWAHDVHISRGEHPDSSMNMYYGNSMGAHLADTYKGAYKAFSLSTAQGEYACYVSYTDFTLTDCPLYQAPRGSLDAALHSICSHSNAAALYFELNEAKSVNWLSAPIPVRFANHVNIEYGYWTRYSIPFQFDGLFFIDQTSSARSYARQQ